STGQGVAPVEQARGEGGADDEGEQPAGAAERGDETEAVAHGGQPLAELVLLNAGVDGCGDGLRHPWGPPRWSAVRLTVDEPPITITVSRPPAKSFPASCYRAVTALL